MIAARASNGETIEEEPKEEEEEEEEEEGEEDEETMADQSMFLQATKTSISSTQASLWRRNYEFVDKCSRFHWK